MLLHALRTARHLWPHLAKLPRAAAAALGAPEPGGEPQPARLWWAMALILPIAATAAWLLPKITLVMSPSVDAWILRSAPGPIALGDLVSFDLAASPASRQAIPQFVRVTKYVLCLPGERIDWIMKPAPARPGAWESWFYCEDRFLGISKPFGHDAKRLQAWRPSSLIIPAGMVYVGSTHPDGFDSRYYGPVATTRLARMEKLL